MYNNEEVFRHIFSVKLCFCHIYMVNTVFV